MNANLFGLMLTAAGTLDKVTSPIIDFINVLLPVLLGLVVAVGSLYCIVLGIKYAKAGEPQEHEKAKKALINAIVGFVLIFVLIVVLNILSPIMQDWMREAIKNGTQATGG